MPAELRLENYAMIDNVVIEFSSGLNLLTGETGAGKSIPIDALGLLLGKKAFSDVIRTGAERAVVAAVFEGDGTAARSIEGILETNGLDGENGSLILRREIAPGGKGRVSVNNQPIGWRRASSVVRQSVLHRRRRNQNVSWCFSTTRQLCLRPPPVVEETLSG